MFSTQSDNCTPFVHIFDTISLFAAKKEGPKLAYEEQGLKDRISDYNVEKNNAIIWTKEGKVIRKKPFVTLNPFPNDKFLTLPN